MRWKELHFAAELEGAIAGLIWSGCAMAGATRAWAGADPSEVKTFTSRPVRESEAASDVRLDWTVLTDKYPVRSTRLEAVNGIAVLDVLGLFFGQLRVSALVETHI